MKLYKRVGCILLSSVLLGGTMAEAFPDTARATEATKVTVPTIELKADQPVQHTMKVSERVQLVSRERTESTGDEQNNPDTGSGSPEDKWVSVTRWSSENESVATVTQNGLVTAVMAGHTKIYGAYEDGRIVTCELTVYSDEVAALTLVPEKSEMHVGETQQVIVKTTPEEALEHTKITWSSSNSSVASVSDSGKITAVGSGETVITAVTGNGITASFTIKVLSNTVTGITLSSKTLSLAAGGQAVLVATTYPAHVQAKITWSTSNAAVAIVNSNGKVTAIKSGTAMITASVGNVRANCIVTVASNGGTISTWPSTFTGTTGRNSSVYVPRINIVSQYDAREYTMPDYIPSLAFLTVDSDLGGATSTILAQLEMYGVNATFFVPVDNLYQEDNLLREIVGKGHAVGLLLKPEQVSDAANAVELLDQANQQLSVITGTPTRLVRVSGGSSAAGVTHETLTALQQSGYSLWDSDSVPSSYQAAVKALDRTNAVTLGFDSNDASTTITLQQLLPYIQYYGIPAKPLSAGDTPVCQVS